MIGKLEDRYCEECGNQMSWDSIENLEFCDKCMEKWIQGSVIFV